uniref:Putative retroelement polyprotein n=1 Tax=Malus domestica TaxID=3750 RepID=G0XZB5_MALDO|nr:putative retroelement polyprotein [Malus domestica]
MEEENILAASSENILGSSSASSSEADGNPNQRLCSILLTEFNYLPWSRAITLALGGRSKLGFINGTIVPPEVGDSKYEEWFCKDQLVMSWLFNSMGSKVSEIFSFSESAFDLWKAVKEIYGNQNNAARIFELQKNLSVLNQDGKTFIEHLGRLKSMWNELNLYRPHTTDPAILLKQAEEDKVFQLLSSLDSTYEDLRSHILMSVELPPLNTPNFSKQTKPGRSANQVSRLQTASTVGNFTSNPSALLSEFSSFTQKKDESNLHKGNSEASTTKLFEQFAKFLQTKVSSSVDMSSILNSFSAALASRKLANVWIIDSGATDHITNIKRYMHDFKEAVIPQFVSVANGTGVSVLGEGKVKLIDANVESTALYVPSFPFQLLSVGRLTNSLNCDVIFSPFNVIFQDRITKKKIGEGMYKDGLYMLSLQPVEARGLQVGFLKNHLLWHRRLRHPSNLVQSHLFKTSENVMTQDCEVCHFSKQTRLPFDVSSTKSCKPFEIVHSDVWGPAPLVSFDGFRYFVTFVDDFSRCTWLYLLKSKDEVINVFQEFHSLVTNQFSTQLKVLRSDNGTEYMSNAFAQYLTCHGIIHQTSCVGTPQQNGVAERKNRDLLEKTRSLMLQMSVPKKFWSHGVLTAAYVINRLLSKGYKCYDPRRRKLLVFRDVVFDEKTPFFASTRGEDLLGEEDFLDQILTPIMEINALPHHFLVPDQPSNNEISIDPVECNSSSDILVDNESTEDTEQNQISSEDNLAITPEVITPRRNPSRNRGKPTWFKDYVSYTSRHPIEKYLEYSRVSSSHADILSKISASSEPSSFQEANSQLIWQTAMDEELRALNENKTWSITKLPKGMRAVGCRWVYKTKFKSDGLVERHKARLVARGFTQTYGIDYKETFAPVAKMNSLHKAIYGLKQSPRAWYAKLSSVLENIGFKRSNADSSLFVRDSSAGKLIVLIYVDDLIVTGDSLTEIQRLKGFLHKKFAIKDLGTLKYFLGIEVASSSKGLLLNQRKYILDLLQESKMLEAKPVATPIACKEKLGLDGDLLTDVGLYQRLVGKLIYLTITRPDIMHAVSLVTVRRILRYLKGTVGTGIVIRKIGNAHIVGYTDADWGGSKIDRRSTTGYCTFVGGNLVTWKSKKQSVVARSSAEAEYRAMASTTCELIWLQGLLNDLGFKRTLPMPLFCDNQAAIYIASNPVFHERTKHIEMDCHFVREKTQSDVIQHVFVRSTDQLADIFTKGLCRVQFNTLLVQLGLMNILAFV